MLLLSLSWNTYAEITPGKYTITTKLIDRRLDIKWGNTSNGAELHIWDPNGGNAQDFEIVRSEEPGYFYIKSLWGKCLDVNGAAPDKLMMWDCHGGDNQKWKFIRRNGNINDIFKGSIDEFLVYNRILTDKEINQLYALGK